MGFLARPMGRFGSHQDGLHVLWEYCIQSEHQCLGCVSRRVFSGGTAAHVRSHSRIGPEAYVVHRHMGGVTELQSKANSRTTNNQASKQANCKEVRQTAASNCS